MPQIVEEATAAILTTEKPESRGVRPSHRAPTRGGHKAASSRGDLGPVVAKTATIRLCANILPHLAQKRADVGMPRNVAGASEKPQVAKGIGPTRRVFAPAGEVGVLFGMIDRRC